MNGGESKDISQMPPAMRDALSEYGPHIYDSGCGEAIGWGYRLLKQISENDFRMLPQYGELRHAGYEGESSVYVVVTKWLTPAEAREQYGAVTDLIVGPRGGFKSVRYGEKLFLSKKLDPRVAARGC